MSSVYGSARDEAVSGNWVKLNNGDKWTGAIINCGATRMVHFDAKPPSPQFPNGQAASDTKHMVFEVYVESIERLGKPVEAVQDFQRFEPQIKWCVKVFDLIDALEAAERNPQAIYGHRVCVQRIDEKGSKGFNYGDLKIADLGPLPAGHPALGIHGAAAPAGTTAAAASVPLIPRPAGAPAVGPAVPASPIDGPAALAAFTAACHAALSFPALKAALAAAWKGLTAGGVAPQALAVYGPRKQAMLVGGLNGAATQAALEDAWALAHAETEKDPAMRAIVEAACVARNTALQAGAGPAFPMDVDVGFDEPIPF